MLLARVIGRVDCARRADGLDPFRFDLLETVGDGRRYVAVDTLGAAQGQLVVTTSAAAARMVEGVGRVPVDLAVVALL